MSRAWGRQSEGVGVGSATYRPGVVVQGEPLGQSSCQSKAALTESDRHPSVNVMLRHILPVVLALLSGPNGLAADNLLVHGDFEFGSTGFTSAYTPVRLDSGEGVFEVLKDPSQRHFLGASFGDHTSGTGSMFAANGATDASLVLWRQTVAVATNSAYEFSGWAWLLR